MRESTHRWSARSQHRAMIDKGMLLLETAIDRACLAATGEAGREALLELLRRRGARLGEPERDAAFVQQLAVQTLQCGYALNEIEWLQQADFAAVAVPVHAKKWLLAALNRVFPKGAVSEHALRQRFVPALRRLADAVGRGSRAGIER